MMEMLYFFPTTKKKGCVSEGCALFFPLQPKSRGCVSGGCAITHEVSGKVHILCGLYSYQMEGVSSAGQI